MKSKSWFSIAASLRALAVFIYDEIGAWGVTAQEFVDQLRDKGDEGLEVHINSPGGSVFDGLAIYNALKAHGGKVDVYIDGLAASMASVIALAGDQIAMAPNALFMIHNPAGGAFGESEDLRKQADLLDKVKGQLVAIYLSRANVDEAEIVRLMDAETWLTADEALEMGFIDVILEADEEMDMAACADRFDLARRFGSLPKALTQSTTEPAPAAPQTPAAAADDEGDVHMDEEAILAAKKKAADEARAAEAKRRQDIRDLFTPHLEHEGMHAQMLDCIVADTSVEAAKDVVIEALRKAKEASDAQPVTSGGVVVTSDAVDKFRAGVIASLSAKAGIEGAQDDPRNEFRSFSLFDVARRSLELANVDLSGMDRMAIVGEAFRHSSSSFDSLLADVASKSMLMGYEHQEEIYTVAARIGSLSDFKTAKRVGMSEFSDLDEIKELGEYKQGELSDYGEDITLITFGKLFGISRPAIINDDLDAFTRVPNAMGRAARRKVGDIFAEVLTANANMADGVALFASGHSNVAASGAAPSTATIDAARVAMRTQTDVSGNGNLNIPPRFFIGPVALEGTANVVRDSQTEIAASQNNSRKPNSVAGTFEVLVDSRFDADSATQWYMSADPNRFDTIEVAFLNGVDAPYMERQDGFTADGATWKVRLDAAAKALDHRGLYRNAGA